MENVSSLPEFVGRYRVVRRLGEGGFAEVYLGQDPETLGLVALKVLREGIDPALAEQVRARFLAEEKIAREISHPAVVGIRETSARGERPCFIAMEFVEGVSFCEHFLEYFREARPRPAEYWAEVARLGHELAEVMVLAHARGIVHRDLKPDNVLVCASTAGTATRAAHATIKVLDFGIAKAPVRLFSLENASTFTRYWTELGTVMGSPPFMAPEQNGAAHAVTGRADVFALGVMLLVTLAKLDPQTLEQDPGSLSLSDDCDAICRRERLPKAWRELLVRMTAEDPDERPEMREVAISLQRLRRGESAFGEAVEAWLRDGRIPAPGELETLVGVAERLSDLTADERAFVQRAPVLALSKVRRRVAFGIATVALALCVSVLGAAFLLPRAAAVASAPAPTPTPKPLTTQTVTAPVSVTLAASQRGESDATSSKERTELLRQSRNDAARLSSVRALNRDLAERLEKSEAALQTCEAAAERETQNLDACRRDLATSREQLDESGARLRLCTKSLRERSTVETAEPAEDALTN